MLFQHMDRIVFAGDSVTDVGRAQPRGEGLFDNLGHGYVRMIDNMLAAYYPEHAIRVTNAGISGNTSRDLLERFDRDVIDLHPDYISICIGINDVWRQFDCAAMPDYAVFPEEYENNVREMIVKSKAVAKKVFLLTPYYMEPLRDDPMRRRMDEYCDICRKLAKEEDCILVDLQEMFDSYFRFRHSASVAWDRVHPNEKGATLIAKTFLSHVDFDPRIRHRTRAGHYRALALPLNRV